MSEIVPRKKGYGSLLEKREALCENEREKDKMSNLAWIIHWSKQSKQKKKTVNENLVMMMWFTASYLCMDDANGMNSFAAFFTWAAWVLIRTAFWAAASKNVMNILNTVQKIGTLVLLRRGSLVLFFSILILSDVCTRNFGSGRIPPLSLPDTIGQEPPPPLPTSFNASKRQLNWDNKMYPGWTS